MSAKIPVEDAVKQALDRDFKEWLGEYEGEFSQGVEGPDNPVILVIKSEKGIFEAKADNLHELPRQAWRAVAEAWLEDPSDKPDPKIIHQGRGVQNKNLPLPHECGNKEYDIRWRLNWGKELEHTWK